MAAAASGPSWARASIAATLTSNSPSFSAAMSAGTEADAFGPIAPIALAAADLTPSAESLQCGGEGGGQLPLLKLRSANAVAAFVRIAASRSFSWSTRSHTLVRSWHSLRC